MGILFFPLLLLHKVSLSVASQLTKLYRDGRENLSPFKSYSKSKSRSPPRIDHVEKAKS